MKTRGRYNCDADGVAMETHLTRMKADPNVRSHYEGLFTSDEENVLQPFGLSNDGPIANRTIITAQDIAAAIRASKVNISYIKVICELVAVFAAETSFTTRQFLTLLLKDQNIERLGCVWLQNQLRTVACRTLNSEFEMRAQDFHLDEDWLPWIESRRKPLTKSALQHTCEIEHCALSETPSIECLHCEGRWLWMQYMLDTLDDCCIIKIPCANHSFSPDTYCIFTVGMTAEGHLLGFFCEFINY